MKRHTKVRVFLFLLFTLSLMGLGINSINLNYKNKYIPTAQQDKTESQREQFENSTQRVVQKKKFICMDREALSSSLLKCPNGIEVQIEKETTKMVDFQVFLNTPKDYNKKESFSMVYALESEPHSRYNQEIHQ